MKRIAYVLTISIFCVVSCNRVEYFPDNPIFSEKIYILTHKGGGVFDEGNTFDACQYGLSLSDGIEIDIQKSSDNNIWLSHSEFISPCGSFKGACFASLTTKNILNIDSCLGDEKDYTQLETIFQYIQNNCPEKFISIDVKAWTPCDIDGYNLMKEMNELAQKIIDLTLKYHLENKVMVESETGDFLYYVMTHSNCIETYLTTLGDFELGASRALKAGFTGISFKYMFKESIVKEQIELLHRKGLKIQLWTVNDTNDFKEALLLNPDFIQTDTFF